MGLASPTAPAPPTSPDSKVVVRRQIVIRSVRLAPKAVPGRTQIEWVEQKGPRCVPATAIAGAAQLRQDSVDLMLKNRRRIRVRLGSSCPALDYYYGFYITPGEDGLVCSDRESIRSRMGGQCEIQRFQLLRPVAAKR
jgi:hypothetical protein